MGRPLRSAPEHGWHHVFSRGIRRETIYYDDLDCLVYLDVLSEVFAEHEIAVFAYCLVGNHNHLGVSDRRGELPAAMHRVGTRYARHFNDRHGFDGPVFKSRYGSRLLTDDRDLIGVSRYIHRNSLDVDPLLPLDDFRWSSFGTYMGKPKSINVLQTEPVLSLAGGRPVYRSLVVEPNLLASPPGHRPIGQRLSLFEIENDVRRVFDGASTIGRRGDRGRANDARSGVATLATDLLGTPVAELAEQYDYSDEKSCVRSIARYRMRLRKDIDLAARHEQTLVNLVLLSRSRAA